MTGEAGARTVHDLIARSELRLEQYQLHASSLEQGSRDREGADEVIARLELKIESLKAFGNDVFTPRTPKDLATRLAARRVTRNS